MAGHHFISYSRLPEAEAFAFRLYNALQAGPPPHAVWLDQRDLSPATDWDEQIVEALRTCNSLLFVMTRDSVEPQSGCKLEWTRALKYKKPVVPLLLHRDAEQPYGLGNRQHIDFSGDFPPALARLRDYLDALASPAGVLQGMKERLADAQRDLRRANDPEERGRIENEIALLQQQIADQQRVVDDPKGAERRVEESVARGLERERQPEKPLGGVSRTKFINPPPGVAPGYFQNRFVETKLIGAFLQDESKRLLTVVGRAGIGKTAMVCRVLKAVEGGHLPDEGGPLSVDGIVYLSATGSRRVTFPDLYADLSRLLPDNAAKELEALYKDAGATIEAKMRALLATFPHGRTPVLLDNFEDVIDLETQNIRDTELDEALRALLTLPHHTVKVILTTRVAPRDLMLTQPGLSSRLELDKGLESPHAENILRELDMDGTVGLKTAPPALLDEARQRTRGYPRALEALFAILSADRYTTLREVLNDAEKFLPEHVVEKLVGEAFNRLDPVAEQIMQALAVYARPVPPAAIDYLLQPYLPGVDSRAVLNRLVNMHFARREEERYYLHPVDQTYALGRIPKGDEFDRDTMGTSEFTRYALWDRAADYFQEVRKPRAEWKTINDLAAQLDEFDLRYEGQDYDTAARVLLDIDFDYLLLWGHARRVVELHERLRGKLSDSWLNGSSLGNLGTAYAQIGRIRDAIECVEQALAIARETGNRNDEGTWLGALGNRYADLGQTQQAIAHFEQALAIARETGNRNDEGAWLGNLGTSYGALGQTQQAIAHFEQALAIARETGNRNNEGSCLGNLGNCYADLGQTQQAIAHFEQALAIARETGNRNDEGWWLGALGNRYADLGQTQQAIAHYEQALAIARETGNRNDEGLWLGNLAETLGDEGHLTEAIQHALDAVKIGNEISSPSLGSYGNGYLALARLYSGDLSGGRAAAEAACQYGVPQNNHYVSTLLGVIALRQGNQAAARQSFTVAMDHVEALLSAYAQNYEALDSKGLTLCGLALTEDPKRIAEAVAAYRAARAITKATGIVQRVLRLFDALAQADNHGVLAPVRAAAAGD